jgi:hypothetical protein
MADEPDAMMELGEKPKKSRKNIILAGIFFGVMAVEAVVVFALVKNFTPPPQAAAADQTIGGLNADEGTTKTEDVDLEVVRVRARNDKATQPVIYELTVFASVAEDRGEEFQQLVKKRGARIQDRFSSVIRAADPERFLEPDLATLRDRFKHELSQIAEDDELVKGVLIPSIVPFSEY